MRFGFVVLAAVGMLVGPAMAEHAVPRFNPLDAGSFEYEAKTDPQHHTWVWMKGCWWKVREADDKSITPSERVCP